MILPNDLEYFSESSSNQPHASSYPDQYLGATQSSNSPYDLDETQQRESSIVAGRDPKWFSEFILYDSDDSTTEAETMSVVETSGSVTVYSNNSISTLPLLDLLPESVPESINDGVTDNISLYRWLNLTELEIEDPAVGLGSTDNNSQRATMPFLGLFVSDPFESLLGTNSEFSLPSHQIPAQNDMSNKVAVPRIHYHKCPTCKHYYSSQSRLRDHFRKNHQPPRFICGTCRRGFQAKKDLKRHNHTHESSNPTFACSCKKSYQRLDSLTRHIVAQTAQVPAETGFHKPV